jgi:hypothetical protein
MSGKCLSFAARRERPLPIVQHGMQFAQASVSDAANGIFNSCEGAVAPSTNSRPIVLVRWFRRGVGHQPVSLDDLEDIASNLRVQHLFIDKDVMI